MNVKFILKGLLSKYTWIFRKYEYSLYLIRTNNLYHNRYRLISNNLQDKSSLALLYIYNLRTYNKALDVEGSFLGSCVPAGLLQLCKAWENVLLLRIHSRSKTSPNSRTRLASLMANISPEFSPPVGATGTYSLSSPQWLYICFLIIHHQNNLYSQSFLLSLKFEKRHYLDLCNTLFIKFRRMIIYPKGNDKDNGSGFISMYVELDITSLSTPSTEVFADFRFFLFDKKVNKYLTIHGTYVNILAYYTYLCVCFSSISNH